MNPENTRLLHPENIGNLLHLISLAFAVNLAYLAFDRFKYTDRTLEIYKETRKKVTETTKIIKSSSLNDTSPTVDNSTTEWEKEILTKEIHALDYLEGKERQIESRGVLLFGKKGERGYDEWIIFSGLFLQLISLYFTIVRTDFILNSPHYYNCIRGTAFIVLLVPSVFVFIGRYSIISAKKKVADIIKPLELSIQEYKKLISTLEQLLRTRQHKSEDISDSQSDKSHQ